MKNKNLIGHHGTSLPTENLNTSVQNYPWYESIHNNRELQQGDILLKFPIFEPPDDYLDLLDKDEKINSEARFQDVIVMSQSCDLATQTDGTRKIGYVLLCQIYFKNDLESVYPKYQKTETWENLRKGNKLEYHLLSSCHLENNMCDFILVELQRTYSVKVEILQDFASRQENRIRLLPPYREHLSQKFARFFMRVGLPVDIPSFR